MLLLCKLSGATDGWPERPVDDDADARRKDGRLDDDGGIFMKTLVVD